MRRSASTTFHFHTNKHYIRRFDKPGAANHARVNAIPQNRLWRKTRYTTQLGITFLFRLFSSCLYPFPVIPFDLIFVRVLRVNDDRSSSANSSTILDIACFGDDRFPAPVTVRDRESGSGGSINQA